MENQKEGTLADWLADNSERILAWVLIAAVLAIVIVAGFYAVHFWGEPLAEKGDVWGQFGDYLGGVLNPVFGFLSVFALLVALVLQTRELKFSRDSLESSQEELKLTREAQAKSAEALDLQNKAIHKQSFEQTFFSMLRLLDEVVGNTVHQDVFLETLRGREAFSQKLKDAFEGISARNFYDSSPPTDLPYVDDVGARLDRLFQDDGAGHLTRYARVLMTILEHLRHSDVLPDDIYPRTLRGLISRDELRLIYFLCVDEKWDRLKGLVEHYRILAYLRGADTGAPSDYFTFLERSAFLEH